VFESKNKKIKNKQWTNNSSRNENHFYNIDNSNKLLVLMRYMVQGLFIILYNVLLLGENGNKTLYRHLRSTIQFSYTQKCQREDMCFLYLQLFNHILVHQNLPGAVQRPCEPLAAKSIGCCPTEVTLALIGNTGLCSTPFRIS
jgi:hypothetical protein